YDVILKPYGVTAKIKTPWGRGEIDTRLMGRFNLSNILAVTSILAVLEMPFDKVLRALTELTPVPGRMQTITLRNQVLAVIDYAHTPDALEQALSTLRQH